MTFICEIFINNFLNIFRELTRKLKDKDFLNIQFQVQVIIFMKSSLRPLKCRRNDFVNFTSTF